jgi:hypothetical protein
MTGTSKTRHNLNKITFKKIYKATSIQNTPIEYTGKCKGCGGDCASTMDECLTCAMGFGPEQITKRG